MQQYHDLVSRILTEGTFKNDSSNTGTLSVFGHQSRYSLQAGFPLLTTKKVHLRSIIHELLWFISGDTSNNTLKENGVSIWDEWARPDGSLGPIYGYQWRNFNGQGIDQLQNAVDLIRNNPDNRRIIVSAWNPAQIKDMALPPCHSFFQFNVREIPRELQGLYKYTNKLDHEPTHGLDLQFYQRSADVALGVPFNIASYGLLLQMVAKITGTVPMDLIHTIGDAHIYVNHLEGLTEQLKREPRKLPVMYIHGDQQEIDDFVFEDFELMDYDPHPAIKFDVAVVK